MIVAASSFLSGVLGLLRDRLLASRFGAGETLDIYFAAFRIPDLVQAIFVAGGISVAFLPLFSEEFRKDERKAFAFANNLLNSSVLILIIICFVLGIFTPQIFRIIAPGFSAFQTKSAVLLTRIMFLSPILFGLSAIFSGILQYFDCFLAYSLAPILYNLGIIFGILFLAPRFGAYGLGFGVVLGALVHFLIQLPSAKAAGYQYERILNFKNHRLKRVLELMRTSIGGAFFLQLNLIVITALSSTLLPGTISIFSFANNIQGLPAGLIGIPFAIAIFPAFSRYWASGEKEKLSQNFSLTLRRILILTFPLGAATFVLRAQIVRIILGAGLWGWGATRLTAACLGIFSLSIFASSLVAFFRNSFYAIQETKIPTLSEAIVFLLNIGLSLLFVFLLKRGGLFEQSMKYLLKLEDIKNISVVAFPLALSFSAIFQAFLLFYLFLKKAGLEKLSVLFSFLRKIVLLTFLMSVSLWLGLRIFGSFLPTRTFLGIFLQTALSGLLGFLVYFGGALALRLEDATSFLFFLLEKTKKTKV